MEAILIAGLWITFSLITCLLVVQRGANPILWFLCSVMLSPALGWILATQLEERPPASVIALIKCPYCGATIARSADGCLRCHADFPEGVPRRLAA